MKFISPDKKKGKKELAFLKRGQFLQNSSFKLYSANEVSQNPEKDWNVDKDESEQLSFFHLFLEKIEIKKT